MAKKAFTQKRQLLTNRNLSLTRKKLSQKLYVENILFYVCETCILMQQDKNKLELMEMWTWKILLHISWTKRRSNIEVLQVIREGKYCLLSLEQKVDNLYSTS